MDATYILVRFDDVLVEDSNIAGVIVLPGAHNPDVEAIIEAIESDMEHGTPLEDFLAEHYPEAMYDRFAGIAWI